MSEGKIKVTPSWQSSRALAELSSTEPSEETSRIVGEVLAIDRRLTSLAALIPFVGPWLIQKSESHTPRQKFWLSWVSISLTVLAIASFLSLLPTADGQLAQLRQRIESEMKVLDGIAEQYRAEHGTYPDASVWRDFANRADHRFFDPWARPYLYEPSGSAVTIRTLGRDGSEGGEDEDADMSARFSPAPPDRSPK